MIDNNNEETTEYYKGELKRYTDERKETTLLSRDKERSIILH